MPKILILYNTRAGHKRISFTAYLHALANLGADVETRTIGRRFNLRELLADAQNFHRIVVAGGDGTVSTVAGMLQHTGIVMVAYPGGTANLLARNLGMPSNPETLAEVTLNGKGLPTDLGELEYIPYSRRDRFRRRFLRQSFEPLPTKVYFSIMAGSGFAARLISQAQSLKSKWGEAAYWLSALANLFPRRATFRLLLDGKEVQSQGIGMLIVNFEKIQFDLKVVSGGDAQDGKLEIVIVKSRNLFGLLPILWGALRERFGFSRPHLPDLIEIYRASSVEVTSRPPLKLQFDGEILKKVATFKARACRGAAMFVYGPEVPVIFHSTLMENRSEEGCIPL